MGTPGSGKTFSVIEPFIRQHSQKGFAMASAVNFLAACIYFFVNYEREPYDKYGNKLRAEKVMDRQTRREKPTGRVFDPDGNLLDAQKDGCYWLGKYSDMPHCSVRSRQH